MTKLPNFRREQTGNAALDRMQDVVRELVNVVRDVITNAPLIYVRTLREDLTTTQAYAFPTTLRFPVKAGEVWLVEFWGYAGCSSVDGMKYAVVCPSSSVLLGELESSSTNTSVANWTTQTLSASTLSAATHVGATSSPRPDRISARVLVGSDGFISLQFCSATAATTTTLTGKSCLRGTRAEAV